MNSIHRVALTVASLASALVLVGAFVAQGYAVAPHVSPTAVVQAATETPAPQIVYIRPAPSPSVIQETVVATAGTPPPPVHVVVPAARGDDGNEGSDD